MSISSRNIKNARLLIGNLYVPIQNLNNAFLMCRENVGIIFLSMRVSENLVHNIITCNNITCRAIFCCARVSLNWSH